MPTDKSLGDAVLKVVEESSYPDDEGIITAEFSSGALEHLSAKLEQARTDVKDSIRELSRLSATDVDGWISQAKLLRSDIDNSQQKSREVVSFAQEGGGITRDAADAASKVLLLRNETHFNNSLVDTLQSIRQLKKTLDTAHDALQQQSLLEVTSLLKQAERQLESFGRWQQARLVDLFTARLWRIKSAVTEQLIGSWNDLVSIDSTCNKLSIRNQVQRKAQPVHLENVVSGLASVDRLNECLEKLGKDLEWIALNPSEAPATANVQDDTLTLTPNSAGLSTKALLQHIITILDFTKSRLPESVVDALMASLVPSIVSRLLKGPLKAAVPAELAGVPEFETVLVEVSRFSNYLKEQGWPGYEELLQWEQSAHSVWLSKRSQNSLSAIRRLLKRGLGDPRAVERVETHKVSREDAVFSDVKGEEDWGTPWPEEEQDHALSDTATKHNLASVNGTRVDDEEDVSGWGFDEEQEEERREVNTMSAQQTDSGPQDEDEDAWGWGDETEKQETEAIVPTQLSQAQRTSQNERANEGEQEVTLKETYHVTSLPEEILKIIVMVVQDADTLARSESSSNPFAESTKDLFLLPSVLLSMFRASALNFYATSIGGEMYLYNDSLYMAEQLRSFVRHRASKFQHNSLNLDADIAALELFGKRAYGREMEAQRTVLVDLLDGAQGFANCSESPFAQECDTAISSVIDRIRTLHQQWSAVLARSALLQSIGSLLVTITNKIIVSIEDMSDISEAESQRLTTFCNRIIALDDLFLPEKATDADSSEQVIPMTAGYTSSWLKFQYLSNILESSLIDIKYLWTEGELSLEFTADEVVDLIEALFADSDHRRRAIQEIRRAGR